MHLGLILSALVLAMGWRLWPQGLGTAPDPSSQLGSWQRRWWLTASRLLIPPLLLLTTALAIVGMGAEGTMFGTTVSRWGYVLGWGFLLGAGGWLLVLAIQGGRSRWQLRHYSTISVVQTGGVGQTAAKLLPIPQLFAGQIGFWRPQLVVSQGLISDLSPEHLAAVLAHEQAHCYYHDTFWFFWFGWLRSLTAWLPHTESLWQELLLLRELRADRWASQQVDPLLLAEALVQVVRTPLTTPLVGTTAFHEDATGSRFTERIEALLSPPPSHAHAPTYPVVAMGIALVVLPLLLMPLHH